MKLVQFGAGNIGRSFIGQIFSRAGWEVVFVDIDNRIIDELNRHGSYTVVVKDEPPDTIYVTNVRGVNGKDINVVSEEVATADIVSTAVGQKALPAIMKPVADGLKKRWILYPEKPLDIVICENLRDAAIFFKEGLRKYLPKNYPFDSLIGLVETSIGKMVPIMSEEEKKYDPLLVYAEAYNTLIVDRKGFKGTIPSIPELDPKENMKAWVDRKLFIHNLGHAVCAYVSYAFKTHYKYIWQGAEDTEIMKVTKEAMWESGHALIQEYPNDFNEASIGDHIEDLLRRFKNRALGDTVFRVGRDLYRKLGPEDRLIGAVKLCRKHGIFPNNICLGIASSLFFKARDQEGKLFENDRLFHEHEIKRGVEHVLRDIGKLEDDRIISLIVNYHQKIKNKLTLEEIIGTAGE